MARTQSIRGRTILFGAAALACLLLFPAGPRAAADPLFPYAPGEVLVGFTKDSNQNARDAALARVQARVLRRLATELDLDLGEPGVHRVATALAVEDAVALLRNDPNVEFAEPNYLVTHSDVADDTRYADGSLWGMYGDDSPSAGPSGTTNVYGCDAEEAWGYGQVGSDQVFVGVIDEGMQYTHPELSDNVWSNPYDPVDGVDNDGNGYVDDLHGWDFFHDDNTTYDPSDGDDHGTHVAGTIGAKGGNGAGVAGVNWTVRLIPAKFLGPNGGYISDAVAALNYLRDLKVRHGMRIVATSNSWGGGGYSTAMHTAILRAAKEGILFVAAAGNSGSNNDHTQSYPSNYSTLDGSSSETAASYEAVIAVAAIDRYGAKASWSSYGATTVDLGAPGVSILSTVPTNGYAYYSGTSMATPHVSGAVALYASAFPAASASQIRSALLANATPTASLAGITVTGGRLNLGGLFGGGSPPPSGDVHDVAVTGLSMPGSVKRGKTVTVNVAVANQGTYTDTFNVSLSASAGTVGSPVSVVDLAPGASTSVPISWTAPNTRVTVTITASATLSGDADLSDNTRETTTKVR